MSDDQSPDDKAPATDAAPEPNYEPEMALDAHDIAEKFRQMIQSKFPGAVVKIRDVTDQVSVGKAEAEAVSEALESEASSPLPTLETLRAGMTGVESSFERCVEKFRQERREVHKNGVVDACLSYLHTGDAGKLRQWTRLSVDESAATGLTDEEIRNYVATTLQDSGLTWMGVGLYLGAFLTRHGLTLQEVMDCAKDPVFAMHATALRVTPATAHRHAMDVFQFVAQAALDSDRGRKQRVFD